MSLFERINTKLITEKKEPLSDKEKYYRDRISQKAKDLGYKSSADLERTVDRGIKAVDKKPGGRYPRVGYATGEPFQPDNNPATVKYTRSNKKSPPIKVPGTGKFPASGKSTLRGRFRYPSMDKDFSSAVKTGEVERDVAKRLKTRLGYTAKDELGDIKTPQGKKNIDNFVSKVMKNQKGTIGTGKGKDSDLYKILKRDIDNRNPTVPSSVINPKTGTRFRKPMPGGFDADGGRTGTKAQQNRYDMTAQRKAAKFDKEIAKQANLPKDLKIPKGGSGDSTPLAKKELNVKYKAAKLKLDYGGRMAEKDPIYQALTDAQKKKRYESIKKTIYNKKSSQPSKSPIKFSTYKYDSKNVVPTGLKGKNVPKFRDINRPIAYKQTTGDAIKAIEKSGRKLTKRSIKMQINKQPLKFASLRKPSQHVKYKKTFGDFAKNVGKKGAARFNKLPLKGKLAVGALAIGGTAFVIDRARKALTPGRLDRKKDFTPTSAITDTKGKKIRFKYDTYNPATKTTTSAKNLAGPTITKDQLTKFKNKEYNIKDQSGKKIDLEKNIQQSAFTKQLKRANKGTGFFGTGIGGFRNKGDIKFLKKYKKAAEYRGIDVKGIK